MTPNELPDNALRLPGNGLRRPVGPGAGWRDIIAADLDARTLDLQVDEAELAKRRASWVAPEPRIKTGWLARYAKNVTSAARGAVME